MIETQLDPRQAMVTGLDQWRHSITKCHDAAQLDRVRDIESVSRMLHLSATDARTRVTHATHLARRRTLSGEVLTPVLPHTATALAAGEIGPAQVQVITETMNAIPASISVTDRDATEANLARYARSFDPTSLHKIGRHLLAHLDPDRPKPRDDQQPSPRCGGAAVLRPPRRAPGPGRLPGTRTQRRAPHPDRTTRRTPPRRRHQMQLLLVEPVVVLVTNPDQIAH